MNDFIISAGSYASIIGLIVSFVLIGISNKTKKAAKNAEEAARSAASQVLTAFKRNELLTEFGNCMRLCDSIENFIKSNQYGEARLRISDLIINIAKIKGDVFFNHKKSGVLKSHSSKLSVTMDDLDEYMNDSCKPLKIKDVYHTIRDLRTCIVEWMEELKILGIKEK